jgi:methylmalonyl-CoA mutase cobalamin-binding subunit
LEVSFEVDVDVVVVSSVVLSEEDDFEELVELLELVVA